MVKSLIKASLFVIITASALATQAKEVLRASPLPDLNYTVTDEGNLTSPGEYEFLNATQFVYGGNLLGTFNSGGFFKRFYLYDTQTKKSTLLLTTNKSDTEGLTWQTQLIKVGNKVFISTDGRLYATNGTETGTRLIANFGIFICCNNGASVNSAIRTITSVGGIAYFTVDSDIETVDRFQRESPTNTALWRSDGTTIGTFQVTQKTPFTDIETHPSPVFANTAFEPQAGFFLMNRRLFQVEGDNVSEVNNFDKDAFSIVGIPSFVGRSTTPLQGRSSAVQRGVVQTNLGAFLCVFSGRIQSSYEKLWHFDADGALTEVADGCSDLVEHEDKLLLTRKPSGLWLFDPVNRNEALLTPEVRSLGLLVCNINGKSYLSSVPTLGATILKIYQVDRSGRTDILNFENGFDGDRLSLESCLEQENSIIVRSTKLTIDQKFRDTFLSYNVETLDERPLQRITNDFNRVIITTDNSADGQFIAGESLPFSIDLANITVLPFLDLLLDESVSENSNQTVQ